MNNTACGDAAGVDCIGRMVMRPSDRVIASQFAVVFEAIKELITPPEPPKKQIDRKSTRLNSSHLVISYAVFCLKKKKTKHTRTTSFLPRRPARMLVTHSCSTARRLAHRGNGHRAAC